MSSSRLVVALAIVGAFVAGLSAGMYFSAPSPSPDVPAENADAAPLRDASSKGSPEFGKGHLGVEASGDPHAVAKRFWTALTMSDEQERQAAWLAMLPNMTAENAAEIRELFRKMDKQGRWFVSEWNVFWKRWGEVDATAALKDIENVGSQYHPDLAEKILKGWAATGSAEARTWLEANRTSPSYHSALRGYLDGLARTNLDRATQDALTLGQGHNMHRLVEVLTEQALRQRELGGMVEWWKSLPEDPNDGSAKRERSSMSIGGCASRVTIKPANGWPNLPTPPIDPTRKSETWPSEWRKVIPPKLSSGSPAFHPHPPTDATLPSAAP